MGCTELSSSCCAEIVVALDLRWCLRELLELPKGSQATVVYDVEHGMTLEPMKGKWASSPDDLGYTEIFLVLVVTSVSF